MRGKKKTFLADTELCFLAINLMIYRIFTNIPKNFEEKSAMAAPIAAIISAILAFLTIKIILVFFKRSEDGSLLDVAKTSFGNLGKYIFSIILVVYIFLASIYTLNEFSSLIKLMAYPTTPLWFIKLFFIIAAVLGSVCGLSAVVRVHAIFVPILMTLTLIVSFSAMKYGNILNLTPVLGKGDEQIISSGLSGLFLYSDVFLLLLVKQFYDKKMSLDSILPKATIFASIINIIVIFAYVFVVPHPMLDEVQFPIYTLLKEVWYGRFFQRVDAVYMLFLAISGMLYLTVSVSLITYILRQCFSVMAKKVMIIPVALIIFLFATNLSLMEYFNENVLYFVTCAMATIAIFAILISGGKKRFAKEKK